MNTQAPPINFSQTPQHLLVTGGTGFVGGHLVRALLDDGHEVTVLTRAAALPVWMSRRGVRHCQSLAAFTPAKPVDGVVNLAGARILGVPWTAARRQVLLDSRVGTTQQLVGWMGRAEHKPRFFVSASAIGYYGTQPLGDDAQLTESSPAQPVFMSELCQQWESAARAATQHGVAVACLRFGLVLGADGGALPSLLLPIRLGLGGRLASGRQWMSWIHIQDLLGAMAHAVQTAGGEPFRAYNVTAPEQLHQRDFSKTAAQVLHRPALFPTPGWPMKLALGEQSDLLLQGQRVQPARLLQEGFVFKHPTLEAALRDLLNKP